MKKSAGIGRALFKKERNINNYYIANLVGCLMAERGRYAEANYIFNSYKEFLPSKSEFIYNFAFCEFLCKNFEKS